MAVALFRGWGVEKVFEMTKIDRWFLMKLQNIVDLEGKLKLQKKGVQTELLVLAKKLGFSDKSIARAVKASEEEVCYLLVPRAPLCPPPPTQLAHTHTHRSATCVCASTSTRW